MRLIKTFAYNYPMPYILKLVAVVAKPVILPTPVLMPQRKDYPDFKSYATALTRWFYFKFTGKQEPTS